MTKSPPNPQAALAAAIEQVRRQADSLQSEIERLEAQRREIASAPPAQSDLHAAIDAWTFHAGEKYRRPLREALQGLFEAPTEVETILTDPGRPWLGKLLSLTTSANERGIENAVAVGAVCLTLGELVAAALKREADSMLGDRPQGLPIAARKAALVKIDAEITARQAALAELRHNASAAGVNF